MIKPIEVAIIYGGEQGRKYATGMKQVLDRYTNVPIVPVMVDGLEQGFVMKQIDEAFKNCVFAMVFCCGGDVTKGGKIALRPNVLYELGYMYKQLGEDNIRIISDKDYSFFKDKIQFPSDLFGISIVTKPEMKSSKKEELDYDSLFDSDAKAVVNRVNEAYGLSLSSEKSFNTTYMPQWKNYFAVIKEKDEGYDWQKQLEKLALHWKREYQLIVELIRIKKENKNKLMETLLVFIYERLLLLLLFKGILDTKVRTTDFAIDIDKLEIQDTRLTILSSIANKILDYQDNNKGQSAIKLYYEIDSNREHWEKEGKLIKTVIEDYYGLTCKKRAEKIVNNNLEKYNLFDKAIEAFGNVAKTLNSCEDANFVLAFSEYNLARTIEEAVDCFPERKSHSAVEASYYYDSSIRRRKILSEDSELIVGLKNYFQKEYYLAEVDNCRHLIKNKEFDRDSLKKKMESILSSIESERETKHPMHSLTADIEKGANENLEKLRG